MQHGISVHNYVYYRANIWCPIKKKVRKILNSAKTYGKWLYPGGECPVTKLPISDFQKIFLCKKETLLRWNTSTHSAYVLPTGDHVNTKCSAILVNICNVEWPSRWLRDSPNRASWHERPDTHKLHSPAKKTSENLLHASKEIDLEQWFPKCGARPPGWGARGAKLFYSLKINKNASIIKKSKYY
jgi:hypothetical protein